VFPADLPRRRSRRRVYVILAIVTIIALLMLAVSRQRNDTRDSISYLVAADTTLNTYQDLAREFQSQILGDLKGAQREDIVALMSEYVARAQEADSISALNIPSTVAPAAAALNLALSSWNEGLRTFSDGLFEVVDYPDSNTAKAVLGEALAQIRTGDAAYAAFMSSVEDLRTEIELPVDFPQIAFLPSSQLGFVYGIVDAVDGAVGLQRRRDIEISAVTLDPKEVTVDGGELILPSTDSVVVRASIRNSGNQLESDLSVSVTLQDASGRVVDQTKVGIAELDPRGSTTVDFDPLTVTPGGSYTIFVTLAQVADEVDKDNNLEEIPIKINEPSELTTTTP